MRRELCSKSLFSYKKNESLQGQLVVVAFAKAFYPLIKVQFAVIDVYRTTRMGV